MYGVNTTLNLSNFKGAILIQVCIGQYQIQFHFHPDEVISIEGKWELRNMSGILIEYSSEDNITPSDSLHLHVLLGKSIDNYSVSFPTSFSLHFTSGYVLTIFDDSKQYESFSIGGINI